MKPVSARLPVSWTSRSKPTVSSISAHSAPVRWSFQRIAGRIGRSLASSVTRPCIWPERPMPATPSVSPSSAFSVASHQSSGFCSDQPGFGVESGYGTSRRSSTSPSSATAMTFTAEVPTSMPMAVRDGF